MVKDSLQMIIRPSGTTGSVVMKGERTENVSDRRFHELRHSEKLVFQMDNSSTNTWHIFITIRKESFKNFMSKLVLNCHTKM